MALWVDYADRAASLFDRSARDEMCETNPMALWLDYADSAGTVLNRRSHGVDETNPMVV
jgi:hypothetical protein